MGETLQTLKYYNRNVHRYTFHSIVNYTELSGSVEHVQIMNTDLQFDDSRDFMFVLVQYTFHSKAFTGFSQ